MAELNSVDSYLNAEPEKVMSWSEFTNSKGLGDSPDHWTSKLADWFTGQWGKARNEYDAYLTNVNNRNAWIAAQSANAYDKMMDDTKYQRMMKDFENAGLNPYLLINNGSLSAPAAPSSSRPSYGITQRDQVKSSKGRDFALVLLAVARLCAAFL